MKQRNMSSICDQFWAATEKQTDRLGQTYLHAHQLYAFGGHVYVNPLNYPLPHKIDPYVNEPDQTCPIVSILNEFLMTLSRVSMQISNLSPSNLATFELH